MYNTPTKHSNQTKLPGMLFSNLLAFVAVAASAVFGESLGYDQKAKACSRELEAIVFHPPNCSFDYLREITKTLVVQSPLLWTDRAASVIETFENTFGVNVVFFDAFGKVWQYDPNDPEPPISASNYNYQRTVAMGEAFASYDGHLYNNDVPFYAYSTLLWNQNGQLLVAFVMMSKANAPLAC